MEVKDLIGLVDSHIPYFLNKWDIGRENERIKRGDHWTPAERKAHEAQGRQAYSFTAVMNKLNIMSSAFRQSKTQWDVQAKNDPNDEIKAEIGSIILRDTERANKFDYKQHDLFEDGKDILWGSAEHYWDNSGIRPKEMIRKLDPFLTIWDTNSTDYDRDDALFTGALDYYYRYQVKEKYGDIPNNFEWGRNKSFFLQKNPGMPEYDVVTLIKLYLRVMRTYHYVIFSDSQGLYGGAVVKKYKSKKGAERELRKLNIAYLMNGLDAEGEVVTKKEEGIDKYVFHYGDIVEHEELDTNKHPIKFFYAFQSGTEVWTMMDLLKDPQRFMDRLYSQVDYAMGKDIKKLYELNVNNMADGETYDSVVKKITETGGVIKSKAMPGQHVIEEIVGKGINPQWIAVIDKMQAYLEDFAGGRNFQGLNETSGESGIAINLKQMAGQMVVYYLISNFSRFKQNLGEGVLMDHQRNDSTERMIKVMGGQLTPEMMELLQKNNISVTPSQLDEDSAYIAVNEGGIPFLQDAELELVVTEAQMSATEKELNFSRLSEAGRNNPTLQMLPTFTKLLLESNPNIKRRDVQSLLQEMQAFQQQQQAERQEERNINKAKVLDSFGKNQQQNKAKK